ncbi:MAG: Nramp family divalent metal transporter [Thaumarchaeota archaeon]|nr:Nramp family divalent metal transporter [Nitrososphaerota archaeon]
MASEDLPEPPKPGLISYLKAVGPGVILGSLAIGSGEWILFPAVVVKFGPYLLWAVLLSCIIQAVVAVESIKYTIYCGQPIHKAYQKLPPNPVTWAWAWTLLLLIPIIWPGWAMGSATAIAALQLGRLPTPQDAYLVLAWGLVALTVGLIVLHVGEKIQRTLEVVSWPLVILFLATILLGVIIAAPASAWLEVLSGFAGFLRPRFGFPQQSEINWFMIAAAIAYIPAGFGFNLYISSYARDKGWGMGRKIGYISGIVGGSKVDLKADELPFDLSKRENLRRWRGWLNIVRLDSFLFFSGITLLSVILMSVMAYALLAPRGLAPMGFQVAAAQAEALAKVLGSAAWVLVLLGGFWALFDTQWGLMDSTSRAITDNFWFASERIRKWAKGDPRRIYYPIIYVLYVVAAIIMTLSTMFNLAQPYELVALGAVLGLFALTLAPALQLIVSNRILPRELRPGIVANAILVIGVLFYGFFITAVALQVLAGIKL